MKAPRSVQWPALRDDALSLATIPATLDPADPAGFAPGQIPVNDDTRPDASLLQKARDGVAALKAKNGRVRA